MQLATTQSGLAQISEEMGLCGELTNYNDAMAVLDWVLGGLQDMAMLDYPYYTNYGIPVLAWPVNVTCDRLTSGTGSIVRCTAVRERIN